MNNLIKTKHKILDINVSQTGLIELTLEKNNLTYLPGDCVAIYTDKGHSRPYSIASGVNDDFIKFLIRYIPQGEVSSVLYSMKKDQQLYLSNPFGWFRPGENINNSKNVFIATGTGIAPFLSYIKTFPDNPPISLFYGVSFKNDLVGVKFFGKNINIAVSQEDTKFHKGRITDLFEYLPISKKINYYCCGREKMINDVRNHLVNNKILKDNIFNEVFFNG